MNDALKTTIQIVLRGFGHQLVRIPFQSEELPSTEESKELPGAYERVRPGATYAPWKSEQEFISTFSLIDGNTLVDVYRCWELWTLFGQSAKVDGDIIEIGVWRCGTGALMAKKAELCGARSTIYPCDTFSGVVKAGVNDSYYQGGEHADKSRDTDDYGFSKCEGITRFVNEQLPIEDRLIMHNLNGHAVFVKIAGD